MIGQARATQPVIPERTDGPILAFRAWRVRGGHLSALAHDEAWPIGGVADARCSEPRPGAMAHLAPVLNCSCGVYAADSLKTLRRYLDWHYRFRISGRRDLVIGAVLIWGAPGRPVVWGETKGEFGLQFRAPHAMPIALVDSRLGVKTARALGLPVASEAGLEALAREISGGVQMRPIDRAQEAIVDRPRKARRSRDRSRSVDRSKWSRKRRSIATAWTIVRDATIIAAITVRAAAHLSLIATTIALALIGRTIVVLLRGLVIAVVHPIESIMALVVIAALLWAASSVVVHALLSIGLLRAHG